MRLRNLAAVAAVLACAGLASAQTPHSILIGSHDRLQLADDATRVAVGDDAIVSAELLSTREVLLLGKKLGTTTLLAWLEDGRIEQYALSVTRDISLLELALRDIHPSISVAIAPDRDVLVLRGVVPGIELQHAAVQAANDYLGGSPVEPGVLVAAGEGEGAANQVRVTGEGSRSQGRVISLIRLEALPIPLEDRISASLREVAGPDVRVRRIGRSDLPDDEEDVLILEGSVPTQVALSRALQLASKLFLGRTTSDSDIEVLADEAGGLVRGQLGGRGQGGGNSGNGGFGSGGAGFAGGLGGGGGGLNVRGNNIQRNIGRATVLSVANGRVLSFLDVAEKPQVRVGVQLYEVDRNALLSFNSEVQLLVSDFDQPSLSPALAGTAIQPTPAEPGTFSDTDVQAGLQSLADGFAQQVQIAGSHAALDALFRVLEAKGIARRLSNPVLTVLSGETAQFQVGGEIPVPRAFTPASGGAEGLGTFNTVEFRNFGVGLSVRPLVGEANDLTLDLGSLISQPDEVLTTLVRDSTGVSPQTTAFATRALQTSARLKDGQSLMVGGLVTEASRADVTKVPVLGDIPLFGWLFRSINDTDDSTELFVVVSPTIVRDPIQGAQLWAQPGTATILESCRRAVARPASGEGLASPPEEVAKSSANP